MKDKVLLMLIILLIFITGMLIATIIYFYTGNIESKPPVATMAKTYDVREEKYKNRSVFILTPKEKNKNDKVILYLHGGTYVGGLNETHWNFFKT